MTSRRALSIICIAAAVALIGFYAVIRRVSVVSLQFAGSADVRHLLNESMDDQKRLSRLDPQRRDDYRRRFDDVRRVMRRLDILALNRGAIIRRYEWILLAVVASILAGGVALYIAEGRRQEKRLIEIQAALESLSRGEQVLTGSRRRDVIGRISSMIYEASRDIGRDRKRLQYLSHLSSWQEAARRHAHEIRTPLTAAQLELDRLVELVRQRDPHLQEEVTKLQLSIREELDRLRDFTRNFTSFATIGQPRLEVRDLRESVDEFRSTFASAWPSLTLQVEGDTHAYVAADREMLRRVLVNLCNNSAMAANGTGGVVSLRISRDDSRVVLDVVDDGPGIPANIRARLFEPYTTTRAIGEGMGLGLAISKKIMLDHGGDIELLDTSRGTAFRLTLPVAEGATS
jgi:signal transduction histidine kinase